MIANRILLFSAVLAALPVPALAQPLMVSESRGTPLAAGSMIDSAKPLSLKAGQHLTLITATGVTINLDGPYNGAPGTGANGGTSMLTKLQALSGNVQRYGEVGTTRGTKAAALPSPWLIDVTHTGTACLRDNMMAVLWRPSAPAEADITVLPADGSWRATIHWPSGQTMLTLDAGVPVKPDHTYTFIAGAERHAVSIAPVPSNLTSDEMRIAWMANHGCDAQAAALANSLPKPAAKTAP